MHVDDIRDLNDGKIRAPRLARLGTNAARPGCSLTSPEGIGTNHKIFVGIEPLAGADKTVPPARLPCREVLLRAVTGRMRIAGQGMARENRIVALGRELAVSLIGDRDRPQAAGIS